MNLNRSHLGLASVETRCLPPSLWWLLARVRAIRRLLERIEQWLLT